MARNPFWSRDELILALDLYFKVNPARSSEKSPEIIELSELLNSLPIHNTKEAQANFRNPTGVYMKLCNFLRFDPNYQGKGLEAGSKLDELVWNEFAENPDFLQRTAAAIRSNYPSLPISGASDEANPSFDDEFSEGKILTRVHKIKERNPTFVRRKKNSVLRKNGSLICEVCGFDFEEYYGDIGKGFAECHHLIPISELKSEQKVGLNDLAIVCSNCHRMLHSAKQMMSIEKLSKIVESRRK